MKNIMWLLVAPLLVAGILVGCSTYKGSFDCPPGPSIGCEPVSLVNDLVNDDELDAHLDGPHLDGHLDGRRLDGVSTKGPASQSTDEEIKVWVREYTDKDGTHKAHNVYIRK